MHVYLLVDKYSFVPEQFFHSFQEAEDNVTNMQRIMRMTLGHAGFDIYVNGAWNHKGA